MIDVSMSVSGLQKVPHGSMAEKVKNRLEQLDDFEEVTG